ncbi:DMT family transporter [Rhodococcus sp. IEGM 1330]|uniref:DMT family transporter n=1 Tax=Rhodococcus sp. IEGM 1330 TaxID=3082225 RepID=UPI0029535487|nr:DMT family transporter [Rhodococcus sp. IEGM 1330]MDV8023148.1 DMT family transporter [Rhodococcus sp. IEGM 1330]
MTSPWLSVVLALVSAFLFACAAVAQQSAAASVPEGTSLVSALVRSPRWWMGVVGDGGGYAVQIAALWVGSVLVVQPLLVTALLFALPMSAKFARRSLPGSTYPLAFLLAAALAVFIVVGDPSEGTTDAPLAAWIVPLIVAAVVIGGAAVGGLVLASPGLRALLLGAAGGLLFGLAAALTKFVTDLVDADPLAALTAWQTYTLIGSGVVGFYLQQRAFQVGPLSASMPAVTICEPLGAAFIGVTVLDERIRTEGAALATIVVVVAVMVVTTVLLSRTQAANTTDSTAADRASNAGTPSDR